ncbi:hypothetical protein ALC56_10427, partial [Trachymyrmex septentrionalis]
EIMLFCLPLRSKLYKYWKPLKTSAKSTHREDHACFVHQLQKKYALFTWRKCVDTILAEDKRTQKIEFLHLENFNQIPVFIRYCGCRNLSPLFSSCSIYILDALIGCGIRGIGTL